MPARARALPADPDISVHPQAVAFDFYMNATKWRQAVKTFTKYVFACDCQSAVLYMETPALARLPDSRYCLSSTP